MFILESFTNSWNYTFIIVAVVAILFGTIVTLKVNSKDKLDERRKKRNAKAEEENKDIK